MFYYDKSTKSMAWKYHYNNLMYFDFSRVTNNDWTVLIPLNISKTILAGKYNEFTDYMDDLHSVNIENNKYKSVCKYCMELTVKAQTVFLVLLCKTKISTDR